MNGKSHLAVLMILGKLLRPLTATVSAIKDLPWVANRWKVKLLIKQVVEEPVLSLHPVLLILHSILGQTWGWLWMIGESARPEALPRWQELRGTGTYIVHRNQVDVVLNGVLLEESVVDLDPFVHFGTRHVVDLDRTRNATPK
jgi:hypothetical protein